MSATEELRKLLDERGVEYDAEDRPTYSYTYWGDWAFAEPLDAKPHTLGAQCELMLIPANPEQAIDATLGRETCRYEPDKKGFTWWDENDVEHYEEHSASDECWSASCDNCGYTMMVGDEGWFRGWDDIKVWDEEDGSEHHGILLEPIFKFCPNCGRKVEQ